MFKDVDFNTKKYLILMFIICAAFFIIVIKAFEYLPTDDKQLATNQARVSNINRTTTTEPVQNENIINEENSVSKKQKHVHIDLLKNSVEDVGETIPEIQAPEGVDYEKTEIKTTDDNAAKYELSSEEKAVISLYKAKNYYSNGEFSTALKEYNSVVQMTNNSELVAQGYEGIAHVYAANRKLGTALAFATKAYTINPSSSRELLLARLYYKTGDIEKATKRVNNILHRDFSNN